MCVSLQVTVPGPACSWPPRLCRHSSCKERKESVRQTRLASHGRPPGHGAHQSASTHTAHENSSSLVVTLNSGEPGGYLALGQGRVGFLEQKGRDQCGHLPLCPGLHPHSRPCPLSLFSCQLAVHLRRSLRSPSGCSHS